MVILRAFVAWCLAAAAASSLLVVGTTPAEARAPGYDQPTSAGRVCPASSRAERCVYDALACRECHKHGSSCAAGS